MIHVLSQETINKIAAGEVVERPVSVIKELVENAIDACASAITVEIVDGGLKLIRVTDNGTGMSDVDIRYAFLRHATSKISDANDLASIATLGFRGEALASIAAVSMVECMTKTESDITGYRYVIEGGKEMGLEEIGCPTGTTFLVKELFYNVPARKKFLKSARTEGGYVVDVINRMALSHPGISFKLITNGKTRLHTSGNFSLKDCIFQIFGKDYAKHAKEVSYIKDGIEIKGVIGEPEISRGNRQYEIYFVNGRYVKSKWVARGIEDGAKAGMMINQFPFAVLFLNIPFDEVDVNVHPNKMEVRFNQEESIKEHVEQAVLETFKKSDPVATVSVAEKTVEKIDDIETKKEEKKWVKEAPEPFETHRRIVYRESYNPVNREKPIQPVITQPVLEKAKVVQPKLEKMPEKAKYEQVEVQNMNKFLDASNVKKHTIIGQAFSTYWIVQYENELYIIDQHAAHEKVMYESWINAVMEMNIPSQQMLEPKIIDLSQSEFNVFLEHQEELLKLGFEIELFGETTIAIKSVPYLLNMSLTDLDFLYMFDELVSNNIKISKQSQYTEKLASLACKAAVKGNNKLDIIEYKSLIEQLLKLEDPYHCPHGRPTMIKMSKYELEKKFRRIV